MSLVENQLFRWKNYLFWEFWWKSCRFFVLWWKKHDLVKALKAKELQ